METQNLTRYLKTQTLFMKFTLRFTLFITTLFLINTTFAQQQVRGLVTDESNNPLSGVTVEAQQSQAHTLTNANGRFEIIAKEGAVLLFSYQGKTYKETVGNSPELKVVINTSLTLGEVVVLGSRTGARSRLESPVPVDVFDAEDLSKNLGQADLSRLLNAAIPSLSSITHSGMNITDFVDAPTLRGMSPSQTLVLLNGKRLHPSSLMNVTGGTSNGSVGTDLNTIPAFALQKIEVLRDGASAQYGSDALAGVIDLQMKRSTAGLTGQVSYGGYLTPEADNFHGNFDGEQVQVDLNYGVKLGKRDGFLNLTGSYQHHEKTSRSMDRAGQIYSTYNAVQERAREAGVDLERMYGNINALNGPDLTHLMGLVKQYAGDIKYLDAATLSQIQNAVTLPELQGALKGDVTEQELAYRGLQRRDFSMHVGQPKGYSTQLFFNTEIPLDAHWRIYGFGGFDYRLSKITGYYRLPILGATSPFQMGVNVPSLYPNGFLSKNRADIYDYTVTTGVRRNFGEWKFDLSNTLGQNIINVTDVNSPNATLGYKSPTEFSAGGFRFLQNTVNLDGIRSFDVLSGLDFSVGAEYRFENYQLRAGNPVAYETYDVHGNVVTTSTPDIDRPTDFFGKILPGGAQGFGGYNSSNVVNKDRNSFAGYIESQLHFNNWLTADGAVRYEHYADFGNTINFKFATLVRLAKDLNFRASASTGFRAPSMAQIYYNTRAGIMTNGVAQSVGLFGNNSEIARLLGIPNLKEERSRSFSTGFTYRIPSQNLSFTADAFITRVDDQIVLTGEFAPPTGSSLTPGEQKIADVFSHNNIGRTKFFANAIDVRTRGIDITITHRYRINNKTSIKNDFGLNLNQVERVGDIHASKLLEDAGLVGNYFDETAKTYLERSSPRMKFNLTNELHVGRVDIFLQNAYYGNVWGGDNKNFLDPSLPLEHTIHPGRILTDLSVGYELNRQFTVTLGATNIFDVHQSRNYPQLNYDNQYPYDVRVSQFPLDGRFVFTKINFAVGK